MSVNIKEMQIAGVEDLLAEDPEDIPIYEPADIVAEGPEDAFTDESEDFRIPKWRPGAKIAVIAVSAAIILFAFIWEAAYSKGQAENFMNDPPRARSAVQDELGELDWVTQAFLPINVYSRPGELLRSVNGIVIHYIGNPGTTAIQNRDYFANLAVTKETYASSSFIICLDGETLQCVPIDEMAYASNNRNSDTLSIELCHPDETGVFTDETYASAVRLTAWLCSRYGLSSGDVIRHYDVTGKICPKYFVENEDAWELFKADVEELID